MDIEVKATFSVKIRFCIQVETMVIRKNNNGFKEVQRPETNNDGYRRTIMFQEKYNVQKVNNVVGRNNMFQDSHCHAVITMRINNSKEKHHG